MYKVLSPLKPNLERYWKIFIKQRRISIQRALMYEALEDLELKGRILDFGGGRKANYSKFISKWCSMGGVESANIEKSYKPTYLLSNDGKLLVDDETFDTILSLNTFEHIFDIKKSLKELYRVLKKDGEFVFSTPFLYKVHGCPDDFNRPTASWWGEVLTDLDMSDIQIIPLVWDPLTSGFSICDKLFPFSFIFRIIVPLYGLLYSSLKTSKEDRNFPDAIGSQLTEFALGYIIRAKK